MISFLKKYWMCAAIVLITLFLDQITKYFAGSINISDPSLNRYYIITLFEKIINNNAGAHLFFINVRHYFEMYQLIIRMLILPVIGFYIAYYLISNKMNSRLINIGLGMLVGALLGNALDIIFRGYVIDWFGCSFFVKNFELNYAINFADIIAVISAPFVFWGIREANSYRSARLAAENISRVMVLVDNDVSV